MSVELPTAMDSEPGSQDPRALMFHNRLRKNLRRLMPWAEKRGLEAYRLYDSDIPEVRLIVERYGDRLVVWEYARRADKDPDPQRQAAHDRFLTEVGSILTAECEVIPSNIYYKNRFRQRTATTGQYERLQPRHVEPKQRSELLIQEGGHRFWVNLMDYLDTGLFLDHRETRALVGRMAAGKRVLNLFGYTGSFTVYAAGGGATSSVTMDLSSTYLNWAARNFAENGMDLRQHQLVRDDVLAFLRAAPATGPGFDLIVLDPPTFSNSKKMRGTLDIERDHPALHGQALRLLAPAAGARSRVSAGTKPTPGAGPAILFSCNNRRFSLRAGDIPGGLPPGMSIHDLSAATLPRDFHDPKTRCCYLISSEAPK